MFQVVNRRKISRVLVVLVVLRDAVGYRNNLTLPCFFFYLISPKLFIQSDL